MGASAPFWRFSAASYPDLEGPTSVNGLAGAEDKSYASGTDTSAGVQSSLRFDSIFYPI